MLSKFSVKKPYTVVVGVVLIMILGVVTFMNLTVDLLPNMNMPYAIVMTTYQGASPEQVEMVVTKPVEQTMATVSNIKNIQSTSNENTSMVMLEFDQTANMDSVTIEMRERLDQIEGFWPDEVGSPLIMKLNPSMMPVLVAAVSAEGENSAEASRLINEKVLPEIESIEGVASVTTTGSIEETVQVTINEKKVEELSDEVKGNLDKQFAEASAALADAKAQVESGKAKLEAGQAEAATKLGQAEAEVSKKAEELKQAQLEITEKMAEINVSETTVSQQLLTVQAQKAAVTQQLAALDPSNPATAEVYATLQNTLQQLSEQETQLIETQQQIAEGKAQLEAMQSQVNDGAMSLAEARGQMASAQLQTAVGLSSGSAGIAVGESAITQQEAQIESAKEEAYKSADMGSVLTVDMIKGILAAQNFNMPAGYVNEEGIDYLVRIGDKFKSLEEMENLVLVDVEGIDPVKLSDVATIEYTDNSDETYAKINGENGMMFSIQKQTGYSTGDVSGRVLDKLNELNEDETLGVNVITLMDQGVYIDLIVHSVLQNLMYGAVLAVLILFVFLKSVRSTFVIACSIPISILTSLVAMYFSGITLNVISLSGLALGVGMLVDNSIVVIENIYRIRNEEGASAKEAAVKGANQVAGAIMASTLTTICVFAPIIFTKGVTRQLFVDMGLTIAYSLLASLLVALTVVPMMAAGLLKKTEAKESKWIRKVQDVYGDLLRKALKWKVAVFAGALLLLILSGVLAVSRGTEFMPQMESTELAMTLETEKGSTVQDTAKVADEVFECVKDIDDIEDIGAMIGSSGMMDMGSSKTNVAQFYAITKEHPKLSNAELKKEIEKATKDIDGELTVSMSSMDMSALGGSGVAVQISGKDLDKLREVASDVKEIIAGVKGTQNVTDGTEESNEELRVIVDKEKAMAHGLTVAQVYQEIAAKLSGSSSATALSTDTAEYDIYVVDGASETMSRNDVRELAITASKQDGSKEKVKLSDIATFEDSTGVQAISRINQNRVMTVSAELKDGENIGLVSNKVKKALDKYEVPEGYEIKMTGEDETINEAMVELFKMLALALIFMYLIMVAQFQSLRSPFIVMFTVPLAFTGGLFALWITGSAISVISMVGFVMLSGIIVNNGIVFVDYTNQLVREGMPRKDALVLAGQTRLRPIIMTALTTILGLSTMAIGVGMGADMARPMALVTVGGLLYGTVLTLFVVPCIYDMFHKKEHSRLRESIEDETMDEAYEDHPEDDQEDDE